MLANTHSEPAPRTPEELMLQFGQYAALRALDQLVALYEPDALFVSQPGIVHRGRDAIRSALAAMLELSRGMVLGRCVRAGAARATAPMRSPCVRSEPNAKAPP